MSGRTPVFLLLALLLATAATAQEAAVEITGVVRDSVTGEALPGTIVELSHPEAKRTEAYGVADNEGRYRVRLRSVHGPELELRAGLIGYATLTKRIPAESQRIDLPLTESVTELREVTVKAPRVTAANDTLTYFVSQIKGKDDNAIEDVLKRLPGVTVDNHGLISYQGKPINKFYIEGLDLLGGRYALASKNIRADDVAFVQVYENHQPIRVLQGVKKSEAAALNIRLKESAHLRPIGDLVVGSGYAHEPLYRGELFGLLVKSSSQHLLTLKGNNIGDDFRYETTSHIQSIDAPEAPGWSLLGSDPLGTPSIPTKQYHRNHSALASYNGITRLRPGITLGVRAIGDLGRIRYSQGLRSALTTPDGIVALVQEEQADRRLAHGSLELHYEDNQSDHYIGNSLLADIRRRDDRFTIDAAAPAQQQTTGYAGTISNGLSYTRRHDGRITSFSSVLSYGTTPTLSLTVDTKEQPQQIRADHFYGRAEGGREWQLTTRSFVGADLTFTSLLERLTTEYTDRAELRGADLRTELSPYYRFHSGKWEGRLTIPLTWLYLGYKEKVADDEGRYNRLRPLLRASLSYRPAPGQSASIGLGMSESLGSFESFIRVPMLTSFYTSTIPGTGTPSLKRSVRLNGSGTFRRPFDDFFTSLYVTLSRSETNRLADHTITETSETVKQLDRKSSAYTFSAMHNITKGFPGIDMLLRLTNNYFGIANTLLRNGEPLDLQNHSISTTLTVMNDFWSKRISSNLDLSYGTAFRGGAPDLLELLPPRMETLSASYRLSITPVDRLSIALNAAYDHLRIVGGATSDNLYLSAYAKYRMKRWEITLDLMNLANRSGHSTATGSAADNVTTRYDLRPREIRLSLKYNY